MSTRITAVAIGVALVVAAGCTSDPEGPDTTGAETTTTIEPDARDECIRHDRLFFVDVERVDEIDDELLRGAVRLSEPGQLAESLGAANDPQYEQTANLLLNQVAVFDSDRPLETVERIDAQIGEGVASPIHAIGFSGHWLFAPADPPQASAETPQPSEDKVDSEFVVIDTGWLEAGVAWMDAQVTPLDPTLDAEDASLDAGLKGHGTFVASVILQHVQAKVRSVRLRPTLTPNLVDHGKSQDLRPQLSDELQLLYAVARTTLTLDQEQNQAPQILNFSGGTYPCPGSEALGVRAAVNLWLTSGDDRQFVAAAGNDGAMDCTFVPAGFPDVDGVGAVDKSGTRATFSNNSDDIELGVDILGIAPTQTVGPIVAWSGTSFAAPRAAARLAAGDSVEEAQGTMKCPGT